MSSNDLDVDKEEFYRRLYASYSRKHLNTFLLTPARYLQLIEEVKKAKTKVKKTPEDYRRVKRFDIIQTPDGERLYSKVKPGQELKQIFVNTEEMYDIIRDYHLRLGHAGRSRMMVALKKKYRNVTAEIVLVYLALCTSCKEKKVKLIRTPTKKNDQTLDFNDDDPLETDSYSTRRIEMNVTDGSIIKEFDKQDISNTWSHPELYSRGQVDILNVTNDSNEEFNYMMVYREYISKFIHLKPLKAVSVQEVSDTLLDIFLVFGAPNILQSKNGISIVTKICRKISKLCPDIKVVVGDGEFSKDAFNGKSNEDILRKLNDWLSLSHSTSWQQGLKYVQYSLNSKFNEILCKTPNEMVFVKNPRKGVASLMAKSIYDDLVTENEFKEILEEHEEQGCSVPKKLKMEESLVLPTEFIKKEADSDGIDKLDPSDDDSLS
ncbi:KRAB-A domain-containing protein 2-like [Plodia interpunctella]|uniref:KRAB-A domain-containing protein 2-like n=1 Tax=Plodia interpunctella TaxID=58824 RepID=UPI0023680E5A|nr:KRAB-A domain-containing protein 2-like [Plodia interpunctella]